MKKYNELIIGSGGPNIISYIGTLKSINNNYPLKNFKYLTGCSAGSLLCFYINIGYTIDEIKEIGLKLNYEEFFDIKLINLFNYGGFVNNKKIINLLKSTFIVKKYSTDITFKELFELTNITLTVNSVNQTKNTIEYFNYINTPDIKVIDALLMTMSIPIICPPIKHNDNLYIDGAVLDPYPINYIKNTNKLGIFVINETEKRFIFDSDNILKNDILNKNDIINNLKDTILLVYYNYLKIFYKKKYKNTIYIIKKKDEYNFKLSYEYKLSLLNDGLIIGNKFFKKKFDKLNKKIILKKYFYLLKFILIS